MKKVLLAMVMAALVSAISVQAEEAATPAVPAAPAVSPAPVVAPAVKAVKRERPPAQDLELTGKVIQVEKVRKNKDGTEVKQTIVALDMTADGIQVTLPANKKDGVDPAAFVGKDVKVFAKGFSEVGKSGKRSVHIQTLVKIEPIVK